VLPLTTESLLASRKSRK
jgi:hypothetical protein